MFKFTKSVCFALLVWLVYRHYDNSTHENVMPFYTPLIDDRIPFPTKINEYQNLEIWKMNDEGKAERKHRVF